MGRQPFHAGYYYHGHSHVHGRGHRHARTERSHGSVDRSSEFVGGGTTILVEDGHVPMLPRSGSDEKPVGDTTNLVIGIVVAIPLTAILVVLLYLHFRNTKRVAQEDLNDKYRSLDFGLDNNGGAGKKRRSAFFGKEKDSSAHKAQLSMDMNLSSPYLLPPNLQQSRESLNSLARSIHKNEDPYRPVTEYTNSDITSLRSFNKGNDLGSGLNGSTRAGPPPRLNPVPTGPLPQLPPAAQTPRRQELPEDVPAALTPSKGEFRFTDDEAKDSVPSVAQSEQVPVIQEPPAAASKIPQTGVTETVRPMSGNSSKANQPVPDPVNGRESMSQGGSQLGAQGLGNVDATHPARNDSMPVINTSEIQDYQDYSEHFQLSQPDHADQSQVAHDQQTEQRPNEHDHPRSAGLGVPGQDNRRLSVGFRPLPPDDFLESEDPEFRANRIRSFYKEYFDDSVKQDSGKPPPLPQQATYHEDHNQSYLGEAAYFDPDTNAFVMPYAAPVTRRAMTPPPNSRRPMPGPRQRGPPGAMRMPGGPAGRPRAGSTMSAGRWAAASPRPDSSASNPRFVGKPRKPMPPPADLNTLPTPAKLKDDSFAILNAMDFAPPPTIKDHAAGRSQSPVGERVPYRAGTPHTPLVSAFEDTTPLPSPHLLRKSGTFTALDFAPPRRFKDSDTMSDAGSIRSNTTGLSSKNAVALRNGAGRVSRLPGDTVFTQADSGNTLKPQWGMRP
ncbi:hypothetical protein DL766_006825 [Monosporascus sp. MC13-8B]|uniref:Uncharacterized protein n=1 Tax=Monosporascus cannonballus TaxID=155416 RepID=A0ABY0GUK6_9PEZI|nr:hypothetical protein DL762_009115 [Monosporascus cannonballus]RYO95790.1 hypothetical protein DL763_003570 [Monosporascus cannonballus]RYP26090.1 hypothetical protein DL766_006825 [Monosporascus sp. MC13-8B]